MRSNIVFVILVLLLAAFGVGLAMRARESHVTPISLPDDAASADASASAAPSSPATTASASASARASSSARPVDGGPGLGRALRVVGLGWEQLAAGIMANDGVKPGAASVFKKEGLEVELSAHLEISKVENALARGGEHEQGADVAILPLQTFVASYERLKALNPIIFLVVAWSEGHEVLLSKHDSFDKLPANGDVRLSGVAGEAASFLGLYALDVAGAAPNRVTLVDDAEASWIATTSAQAKGKTKQARANVLLTTAEASRLVPFVAIAQASMIEKHEAALVVLARGWQAGHQKVATSASEAARKIAESKGAPEPLVVLAGLGEMSAASLAENAHATGLAGRGAVTLEALFQRTWRIWRDAKVLGIPPETAPVTGNVVAALVRAGADLSAPPSSAPQKTIPRAEGKPILVHRTAAKLDQERVLEEVGLLAGVFRRSPVHVTVFAGAAPDKRLTKQLVERARERFDLPAERLLEGKATPTAGAGAAIEVMPVP